MNDFKNKVRTLLKAQGTLEPSDEWLIDELWYNIELSQKAKDSLSNDGLIINTVRDPKKPPYYQKNPLFSVYDTCIKNIQNLYSKLNVAPVDRARIQRAAEEAISDSFDKDFD